MEFDAVLCRLPGKIAWTVCYVPAAFVEEQGSRNRINVCGTVDGVAFRGTLLPSRIGHYLIYSHAMRDQGGGKSPGDPIHVELSVDTEPRPVEIPDDLSHRLADARLVERFASQPAYLQREAITHICSAKTAETRARRIDALLHRLGDQPEPPV